MPILLIFISAISTIIFVLLFRKLAGPSLLDIPNERSSHTVPRARGAGISFILAASIILLVSDFSGFGGTGMTPWILIVLVPLVLVGFLDDLRKVPFETRLFVHVITAFCLLCFLPGITSVTPAHPWLVLISGALFIVSLINFYNFMDGIDGLVAACTSLQLIFIAISLNQEWPLILAACLFGFLAFNWSPAKVFMGDSGSTFLGAVTAFSILCTQSSTHMLSLAAVTLPLTGDAIYTLLRRAARRENIIKAHRCHLYQRLVQAGWPHSRVSLLYAAGTIVFGLILLVFPATGFFMCAVITLLGISLIEWQLSKV